MGFMAYLLHLQAVLAATVFYVLLGEGFLAVVGGVIYSIGAKNMARVAVIIGGTGNACFGLAAALKYAYAADKSASFANALVSDPGLLVPAVGMVIATVLGLVIPLASAVENDPNPRTINQRKPSTNPGDFDNMLNNARNTYAQFGLRGHRSHHTAMDDQPVAGRLTRRMRRDPEATQVIINLGTV